MTDSIKQRLVSADDMRMNGFAAVADHIDAQAARIAELEAQQDADMRDLIKAEVVARIQSQARADALREAASVAYMECAKTRHVKLGITVEAATLALIDKEPTT